MNETLAAKRCPKCAAIVEFERAQCPSCGRWFRTTAPKAREIVSISIEQEGSPTINISIQQSE